VIPALKPLSLDDSPIDLTIGADAKLLSGQLNSLRQRLFPPEAKKRLRLFSIGEVAKLLGVSVSHLRHLSLEGHGPVPETASGGRRHYSLDQINELRQFLADSNPGAKAQSYLPRRQRGDHLQVIGICNFKGGSAKTTTAVYLAQGLALRGYRVLAIDLDPQASLSSLFGIQPAFDVGENESLFGALRYDGARRSLKQIVKKTYFTGVDLIPANIELQEFEHETARVLGAGAGRPEDLFFARVALVLSSVEQLYDVVVIDCPPQLGFLTLAALCASTSVLVTVHPEMLDIGSMDQFLAMAAELLRVVRESGGDLRYNWFRYLVTRFEPTDGAQAQVAAFLRALFGERVLTNPVLKSTAISDAGLTKQTLYEIGREKFNRETFERAMGSIDNVNLEVEALIKQAWGRRLQEQ
jgi:chromosome partitioning protein